METDKVPWERLSDREHSACVERALKAVERRPGRGGRGAPIAGWLILIVAVVAIVSALG